MPNLIHVVTKQNTMWKLYIASLWGGWGGSLEHRTLLPSKRFHTPSSYTLSALPFAIGRLASLSWRITTIQMSLVAAMHPFIHGRPTISPPPAAAVLPTIIPSLIISWGQTLSINLMSAGLANAIWTAKNWKTISCEPCSYYDSASVPKWPRKQSQRHVTFKNFLGEHAPTPP